MIGLDTNILVRYLTQDDPVQSRRVNRLMTVELTEQQPGFVSLVVIVELCWVLQRAYGVKPGELAEVLGDLLDTRQLVFESRPIVARALTRTADVGGDLPDAIIAECGRAAGSARTLTFDRGAVRMGMELLR